MRHLSPFEWSAQIIKWGLLGLGETQDLAYENLQERFNKFKADGKTLPRPGARVPIEFAPTDRVGAFDNIAEIFFPKVLDMDYSDCWISDESSLSDFHFEKTNEHFYARIWEVYGIDVADIEDGNLVKIFERIHDSTART